MFYTGTACLKHLWSHLFTPLQIHKIQNSRTPSSINERIKNWSSIPQPGQKLDCSSRIKASTNSLLFSALDRTSQVEQGALNSWSWNILSSSPCWTCESRGTVPTSMQFYRGLLASTTPQHQDLLETQGDSHPLKGPCHWEADKLLQWWVTASVGSSSPLCPCSLSLVLPEDSSC